MGKPFATFGGAFLFIIIFIAKFGDATAVWQRAHATFYGGSDASGTMGGACGYGNLYKDGYGTNTAALSTALFNNGNSCGGCYQIVCDSTLVPQWCLRGTHITITATNFCPPNYALPNDNGGWCYPPRQHFDMSQPAFQNIAIYKAGIVPVFYRKVRCRRTGGCDSPLTEGTTRAGPDYKRWRNWRDYENMDQGIEDRLDCHVNELGSKLAEQLGVNGQALSFRVQTSDGRIRTAYNVAPSGWRFGQTFTTSVQF